MKIHSRNITFFLFIVIISICYIPAKTQNILQDLYSYKSKKIRDNITIITVKTNADSLINYRIIIDYDPTIKKNFPGAFEIFSQSQNFYNSNPSQVYFTLVTDTNAIDSSFIFLNYKIFYPDFDPDNFEKNKEFEIKKLDVQQNTLSEFKKISKEFCFNNNPLVYWSKKKDVENLFYDNFETAYKDFISSAKIYIVAVGNFEHDSILKYAEKNFVSQPIYFPNSNIYKLNFTSNKSIFFKNKSENCFLTICSPIEYYFNSTDYFAKLVLLEIFKKKIREKTQNNSNNYEVNIMSYPNSGFLSVDAQINDYMLYDNTISLIETFRDMLLYTPSGDELADAKQIVINNFKNSIRNPYNIGNYAYLLYINNLPNDFFSNYESKIYSLSDQEFNLASQNLFQPDNLAIMIQADFMKSICELLSLSKFYRIEFFDANNNKYKVIPLGFNADFVLKDYLNSCMASTLFEDLTVKFHIDYKADTTYKAKGIIYKKGSEQFYYKTELFVGKDSLLQQLLISNGKDWLDSSAVGAVYYDKPEDFWIKIYQSFIFPEMYYDLLQYKAEIICDTALYRQNIYKIKITTPYSFYFNDYYNYNKKEKYKTEIINVINYSEDTLQIIEYSDFTKISNSVEYKIPFTISQKIKDVSFVMKIDEIDEKSKIKKKTFNIKKPKK